MKLFKTYITEWEKNAKKDAYWSVLTSPQYETTTWDQKAFFASGKQEMDLLQNYMNEINLSFDFHGKALDFGCGTGRLTQALGSVFCEAYGVDISLNMIQKAKEALPSNTKNIQFIHNPLPNLHVFPSHQFDFIYSNIVLQHIAPRHQLQYLKEFVRLVKPGGWIVIQIPAKKIFKSLKNTIKGKLVQLLPYRVKKKLLLLLGNQSRAMKDFDFEINTRSERSMQQFAKKNRLKIQHIAYTNSCEPNFCGNLKFKTYNQASDIPGYLSPMYFFKKSNHFFKKF